MAVDFLWNKLHEKPMDSEHRDAMNTIKTIQTENHVAKIAELQALASPIKTRSKTKERGAALEPRETGTATIKKLRLDVDDGNDDTAASAESADDVVSSSDTDDDEPRRPLTRQQSEQSSKKRSADAVE